jgi:hypothetical protein
MQPTIAFSASTLPPSLTDPSLYGGIPARISSLTDAREYEAAFDQVPIAGAFSHEIAPRVWVGAQAAAGILAKCTLTRCSRVALPNQWLPPAHFSHFWSVRIPSQLLRLLAVSLFWSTATAACTVLHRLHWAC